MKLLVATSLACAAACGASPTPSAPDAPTAADAPRAADASLDAAWSSISSTVKGMGVGDGPIAGATICVLGHAEIPCATSGADGSYTISLPDMTGEDIAVLASAPGYLSEVTLLHDPSGSIWESELLETDAEATTEATQAGFTYPGAGTGFLQLRVDGNADGYIGAQVAIAPIGGGTASAKGPVYWDENGPNPSLTATASAALGVVSFGDIAPGRYAITVTAPAKRCTVSGVPGTTIAGDWPPSGGETADVEIAADAYTMGLSVICNGRR